MKKLNEKRKRYPSVWKCYKMPLIALDRVVCGESEYSRKIERLLDDGFRLTIVYDNAVPADEGFICDCGEWVYEDNYFHEVLVRFACAVPETSGAPHKFYIFIYFTHISLVIKICVFRFETPNLHNFGHLITS